MSQTVSRRSFVQKTSAGAAAIVGTMATPIAGFGAGKESAVVQGFGSPQTWIHAHLRRGLRILNDWEVARVSPVYAGSIVVILENVSTMEQMRIDICKKDESGSIGVETTSNHELVLMNGGKGRRWTRTNHHLVVRAMAKSLSQAERNTAKNAALMSHRGRVELYGVQKISKDPTESALG